MEPDFSFMLRRHRCTPLKLTAYESAEHSKLTGEKLYRVKKGRSWVGGLREQATLFTYQELTTLWSKMVAKELSIKLPKEIDPDDFPKGTVVEFITSLRGYCSGTNRTRTRPYQDDQGVWKVVLYGIKKAVELKKLKKAKIKER